MPRKSIRSLKSGQSPKSPSHTNNAIRSLVENIQKHLKSNDFDLALTESIDLSTLLQSDTNNAVIYLTSLVWQIRAMQGLKRSKDDIEQAVIRYAQESSRLGDHEREVQAHRIHAQLYIDCGNWTQAAEHLENALTCSMAHNPGRTTLEILMHLSAIELKMCHYVEAIDYLSRAMNAIKNSNLDNDDFRELSAIGNRQLCELYNTIGEGQSACDALEAAQNANSHDDEELWLQNIYLSHLDMRSGDADTACVRLKKIEDDVRTAVRDGKAKPEQLTMIQLERAQALWNHGEFKKALDYLEAIEIPTDQLQFRQAQALIRFQWAAEMGKPSADTEIAGQKFSELCNESENPDIQIVLAASLTQAAIEIERGHYDTTLESLEHITQTAAFTQLIPFATRALALRGQINLEMKNYSEAAVDCHNACEMFVSHVDDVSARQAAALMLLAQTEQTYAQGNSGLDPNERTAFEQLLKDVDRFKCHHHVTATIDLALTVAEIAYKHGEGDAFDTLMKLLEEYIDPPFMAFRRMKYLELAMLAKRGDFTAERKRIAEENGFKC